MKRIGFLLASVGLLLLGIPAFAQNADHGATAYKLCAGCHGFRGEGNQGVAAPALAGQETWYLERQIRNFQDGVRGHASDDDAGQLMAEMTRGLDGEDEIRDIVAYIDTLPAAAPAATLEGNVDAGAATYGSCAVCHGTNAEGNAVLNAPALARMDDWYQLGQLQKFKAGVRGRQPGDVYGAQMAPMAAVLADEDAMRDVIAYINSLETGD